MMAVKDNVIILVANLFFTVFLLRISSIMVNLFLLCLFSFYPLIPPPVTPAITFCDNSR